MSRPTRAYVLGGLLQRNYFPAHKADLLEVPPAITSETFTPAVAELLVQAGTDRGQYGYDCVSYRTSRFDGVPRLLQIPHPVAYAVLASEIAKNWKHLEEVVDNPSSRIRPAVHSDGRLVVMNYEDSVMSARRELRSRRGMRFLARADISNCYGSIYSHAIPWAAAGHEQAKKGMGRERTWYNKLDVATRRVRRNETQGIPIGPGTSAVVAEFILGRVDEALRAQQFEFCRYMDDYTAYCRTEDGARRFIASAEDELARFRLTLSHKKSGVFPLPQPIRPQWLHELSLMATRGRVLSTFDVYNYLDMALGMSSRHAGGSVLKYAVKTLMAAERDNMAKRALVSYTMELALYHPVLVPLLHRMFEELRGLGQPVNYWNEVNDLAAAAVAARCSDALAWCLYYLKGMNARVDQRVVEAILDSADCVGLTMLYWTGQQPAADSVVDFAKGLMSKSTSDYGRYDLDTQWLLLYQLYFDKKINSPYTGAAFRTMRSNGVTFLRQ